jgi:hypothetical protein
MAQYRELTDGTGVYRIGVRDEGFVIDVETTATGFDGDENTDWEELAEYKRT